MKYFLTLITIFPAFASASLQVYCEKFPDQWGANTYQFGRMELSSTASIRANTPDQVKELAVDGVGLVQVFAYNEAYDSVGARLGLPKQDVVQLGINVKDNGGRSLRVRSPIHKFGGRQFAHTPDYVRVETDDWQLSCWLVQR